MRPVLVMLLLAGCLAAQSGGIAGIVVDQTSGRPLRGVHVRMITGDFGNLGGIEAVYGAISDPAGRFSMENIKPGFYLVMAERAGFVQIPGSQTSAIDIGTLTVKGGQRVTDYKIAMTARALIAGRVVDEYGDPVPEVAVQAQPTVPGRRDSMLGNSGGTTDDRGEFRLTIPPGKYYLRAASQRGDREEIRTEGTSGGPFVPTYYPNALNTSAASLLQVGAGQDVAGVEIRLMRVASQGSRQFTIAGTVIGAPVDERATVTLQWGESAGQLHRGHGAAAEADGKFTFKGLSAGFYRVWASYSSGETALQSREVEFHLDSDETNLQLALLPGGDVTGLLEFVGGEPAKVAVVLQAVGGYGTVAGVPVAEVGKDGRFLLPNIPAGRFRVAVEPVPENAYVKEVALNGKTVGDGVLDLSQGAGGSRVKITVSRNAGRLSGMVVDKDGETASGLAMVFLMTGPKQMESSDAQQVKGGKYSFQAIRPGKYRLFAIDVLELMGAIGGGNQEETMKPFFDAAGEIEVKEGDRLLRDITVWTKIPEQK